MARAFYPIMQRRLILFGAVLVWLLFVASFLMPVAKAIDATGGAAFWHYMAEMWDVLEYWRQVQREPRLVLVSAFPSTNGLMFIAPIILLRWPRWSGLVGVLLTFGGLAPLVLFFEMILNNELRVGFYCWVISIFLMALLCLLDWTRQRRSVIAKAERG
jgi:hypothetical protein